MSRTLPLIRRFGPVLLLLIAVVWVLQSGLLGHLTLDELAVRRSQLQALVAANPLKGLGLFLAADFVIACLGVPGSGMMTVLAGFLFGPWLGGLAALVASSAGSTVFFMVCRGALGDILARRAGPRLRKLEDGVRENGFAYLLSLRLLPIAPMPVTNLAAALFGARLKVFVPTTVIGMTPAAFIFAGLGAGLGQAFARGEHPSLHLAAEPRIWMPLAGVALLALLPTLYALLRRRKAAA